MGISTSKPMYSILTRGAKNEALVLSNLKLKVVLEVIRIALDIVYRPQFFKTSHGCQSGSAHFSVLKFVRREISNPDWWFTLVLNKKLDYSILNKLISTIESQIEDPSLYTILRRMLNARVLNLEFGGFYKGYGNRIRCENERYHSKMRSWFRRQMNGNSVENTVAEDSGIIMHTCHIMDEILIAISGPKEVALSFKSEI
ncbi:hypothetical protein LguiA_003426 [Lonicera macranthoides]